MRNKQVIERFNDKAAQAVMNLLKDIDSNKPHMTVDYIKSQLRQITAVLETQQQYLDLED